MSLDEALLSNESLRDQNHGYLISLHRIIQGFTETNRLDMDLLFQAMSFFRRRQFALCIQITTRVLDNNPNDQVIIVYVVRLPIIVSIAIR
jgi:hypothetical protein